MNMSHPFYNSNNFFSNQFSINDFILLKKSNLSSYELVYTAKNKNSGNVYFLRTIPHPSTTNFQSNIDYMREVYILNDLSEKDAKFIVKYFTSFQDNNYIYIVYEFEEGKTLEQLRIEQKEKNEYIKQKRIINILTQLLEILEYLQDKCHIMHRQIRPENIIINSQNKIKLFNFGKSAYVMHKDESLVSRNSFNKGTMPYIAPEILNKEMYNYQIDIYCLGLTMYSIMNPTIELTKTNISQMNNQIKNEFYDEWLINFVENLRSPDVNSRYTAKEALQILSQNLNNPRRPEPDVAIIKPNINNISTEINKNRKNIIIGSQINNEILNLPNQSLSMKPIEKNQINNDKVPTKKNNINKNDMSNILSLINLPVMIQKYHHHPLINCLSLGRNKTPASSWSCDICGNMSYYSVPSFYCINCDFDVCQNCILKLGAQDIIIYNYGNENLFVEEENSNRKYINEKVHFHPMLKIQRDKMHSVVEMMCSICLKNLEKYEIFYYCNLCNHILCIDCYNKCDKNKSNNIDFIGPNTKTRPNIILK